MSALLWYITFRPQYLQHQVKSFTVACLIVVELNSALIGPYRRWAVIGDDFRCLTGKLRVLRTSTWHELLAPKVCNAVYLLDALHRYDIGLYFAGHAHTPVEGLGNVEGIGYSQANQTSAHVAGRDGRDDCKHGGRQDKDGTYK